MELLKLYYPYLVLMGLVWGSYVVLRGRAERRNLAIKQAALDAGLVHPASLHPLIDPAVCLGCGSCVKACPEGDIIGLINGKAELIEPTHCIGHGACKKACPTGAIRLVFGTAERGVDLPVVGADFQTNVPGIFVAGELGGMGLIRNAIEQGHQAVSSIAKLDGFGVAGQKDLVIVGAGPAGISAALAAKENGLDYVVVEQDDLGGTVFKYPRGKLVMTAPATLPIVGKVNFREVSKEDLLAFWKGIETSHHLNIRYHEQVDKISALGSSFEVHTRAGGIRARAVLLAIGRRGTPRRLGVPGEDAKKVVYHLIDPQQYAGKHVLVVGGGDSALEAATRIAEQKSATVTLSYRGSGFKRAHGKNREKAEEQSRQGRLTILMQSDVKSIDEGQVVLRSKGQEALLRNDAVIICIGGVLATDFLTAAGVTMETKFGEA